MALLLVLGLCMSCDEFAEGQVTFRELLRLRDQIAREFREEVVDVSVTSRDQMIVQLVNSPLRSRTSGEKQQHADAVAAFVSRNFRMPLSSVSIQFVSRTGDSGSLRVGETYVGRPDQKP